MTARSILLACVLTSILSLRPAAAGLLEGVPDAIVCDFEGGKIVVYVTRRLADGSTQYESLERAFMTEITIDAQGVLHWQNRPDCDGKTVDQLREEGKAFDFSG
jgi:hypothetical protein